MNKGAFGSFPFPLTKGAKEPRHLTWLRNHSNYMGVRGFLDYIRAGAVLLRGMIINFLILLSLLLTVSVAVSYFYHTQLLQPLDYDRRLSGEGIGYLYEWLKSPAMPKPYSLTFGVLLAVLAGVLISPIFVVLGQIAGQKKSMENAGSSSSVKRRDKFERVFGGALLLVLAVALFESLPVLAGQFHQFLVSPAIDWNTIFASAAGVSVAVLGVAGKLLSVLGGVTKKLAMLLIGLLGLLAPLIVILYVVEYLIFEPPKPMLWFLLLTVPVVGVAALFVATLLSMRGGVTLWERGIFAGLFVMMVVLVFVVNWATDIGYLWSEADRKSTERHNRNLIVLADGLVKVGKERRIPKSLDTSLQEFFKIPDDALAEKVGEDPENYLVPRIPKLATILDNSFRDMRPFPRKNLLNALLKVEKSRRRNKLDELIGNSDPPFILRQNIENHVKIERLLGWLGSEAGQSALTGITTAPINNNQAQSSGEQSHSTQKNLTDVLSRELPLLANATPEQLIELIKESQEANDQNAGSRDNAVKLIADWHSLKTADRKALVETLRKPGKEAIEDVQRMAEKFSRFHFTDRLRLDCPEKLYLFQFRELSHDAARNTSQICFFVQAITLSDISKIILESIREGDGAGHLKVDSYYKFILTIQKLVKFVEKYEKSPNYDFSFVKSNVIKLAER